MRNPDAFKDVTGEQIISRTGVSQVTQILWDEYEAFRQRDLSDFDVAYLFLDAVFEALRRTGQSKEGILCAWAILTDGRRVLLHLGLGNKESYENWLDFLRDMVKRGLKTPLTFEPGYEALAAESLGLMPVSSVSKSKV